MSAIMSDEDRQAMAEVRALERGLTTSETMDRRDRKAMEDFDRASRRLEVRADGLCDPMVLPWLLRRTADRIERERRAPKRGHHKPEHE